MLQNLKVDIVYYKMETDFEMEFNLGGCCRMRLLTDKADGKKEYLNMLARAVQRSKVIISCGSLFSQDGIISITAHLIGKGLETVNNGEYGIKSSDEIQVISGSIPLVTPDGIFGGCIIESGPQTIILLSESKVIRKTIMNNLIHPYIEDISTLQPKLTEIQDTQESKTEIAEEKNDDLQEAIDDKETTDEITEEQKEITEEKEKLMEEQKEITEEKEQKNETSFWGEHNIEFVMFDGAKDEKNIPDDTVVANAGLIIEPENIKYSKKSYYDLDYTGSESDKDFYLESNSKSVTKKDYKLPIIVISILLGLILLLLAFYLLYIPLVNNFNMLEYVKAIFRVSNDVPRRF